MVAVKGNKCVQLFTNKLTYAALLAAFGLIRVFTWSVSKWNVDIITSHVLTDHYSNQKHTTRHHIICMLIC